MRTPLLILTILLFAQSSFAAVLPHAVLSSPDSYSLFHKKPTYVKGKGTVGLIMGAILGPVGYFGVRLFSHNEMQRHQAGKGFEIWGKMVFTSGLLLLAAYWKTDFSNIIDSVWQ